MLRMFRNDGQANDRTQWQDGEPVPEWFDAATSVVIEADGRELELIRHAINGDSELVSYIRAHTAGPENPPDPIPLPGLGAAVPRLVQLIADGSRLYALDAGGGAWERVFKPASPRGGEWMWSPMEGWCER